MILRFSTGNREIQYTIQPGTTLESVRQKLAVLYMEG